MDIATGSLFVGMFIANGTPGNTLVVGAGGVLSQAASTGVTGTGTAGNLAKWTTTTAIGGAAPGTDYIVPGGLVGGQTINGGTASADNLNLRATSNGTILGNIMFQGGLVKIDDVGTIIWPVSAESSVPTGNPFIKQYASGNFLMGCAVSKSVFINAGNSTVLTLGNGSTGNSMGFFGASAVAKPTVTGSKSANAALASLLTALAGMGLLTDSST